MDEKAYHRLKDLLSYVSHLGKLNQKSVFRIDEYKNFHIWEHPLKGRIGVQHNLTDSDGESIWLRIERLKRTSPPEIPENIQEWLITF